MPIATARWKMLSYVKINNFKTYVGETVIGPLQTLTVVLGGNGSGKITDYTL
jgi:chromosome segregation ATPase